VLSVVLCVVALHAEPVNESAILVTWAAKASPPYTVHYWLADAIRGSADAARITRSVVLLPQLN